MGVCVCVVGPIREEAQRVWDQREAQWERERRARERLMDEVKCTS